MPAAEIPVLGKAAHVDVVRIEGKASFACDIGDLIRVRYTKNNPVTKNEQALVGKVFVGQVVRFYKEPAVIVTITSSNESHSKLLTLSLLD